MVGTAERSVVAHWNESALEAIRLGDPVPTEMTRALHMSHAAFYDAWAAYDPEAVRTYYTENALGEDSADARALAVNYAAFRTHSKFFPDQVHLFRNYFTSLGLDPDDTIRDPDTGAGIGNPVAATLIEARAGDNSNAANDYADTTGYIPQNSGELRETHIDPNAWTRLRVPNYTVKDENGTPAATDNTASYDIQNPIGPDWGSVEPFAIAGRAPLLRAASWVQDNDGEANGPALFVSRPLVRGGDAGEQMALFELSLSRPALQAFEVSYQTVDGGATAGVDYASTSGTLGFVAGQQTATVAVPVFGDAAVEASESFTLAVTAPDGVLDAFSIGEAMILDDDTEETVDVEFINTNFVPYGEVDGGIHSDLNSENMLNKKRLHIQCSIFQMQKASKLMISTSVRHLNSRLL